MLATHAAHCCGNHTAAGCVANYIQWLNVKSGII